MDEDNPSTSQKHYMVSPMTIKQINDVPQSAEGNFIINNVTLVMVSFVGTIKKVCEDETFVHITIEDGTGSVEVRKMPNNSETTSHIAEMYKAMENKHVRVIGGLIRDGNKRVITKAKIRVITDHNELLYKTFDAMNEFKKSKKLPVGSSLV
ncbi:hypothetical protein JCM33374_g5058 [Metschnikowia sp. JCM 33374]|nr:hypothetical protein JCM33374_g5058 [Metschnikowia sp. JCM 33374]